ncbi:MAG: cysteine hydrolase family protein [Acidobacteria bacterium]|nr:cysteine hydrolase family protein [Acidobacteriota bacterium]
MKTVYFDIDTQIDFMLPAGALYAPRAESIVDAVARLNRHAAAAGAPLVSTMDAHLENDPEFRRWPPHCVAGTVGQQKAGATLLDRRLVIPLVDAAERIDGVPQLLLEKRSTDCFTNPNIDGLLLAFNADRYVVYGVVTEVCVKFAVEGLLARGHRVELVTDAVKELNSAAADALLNEFAKRGVRMTTVGDYV